MTRIAIIQFPGINTEYETRREINKAGMKGEFFRWNDDPEKLKKYDGYVIGGGFAYEDRGRAGIIAALDPIMNVLREETAKGKPLLGICNGCQIGVETGLAPASDGKLMFGMARNKRMIRNEVLGTSYYNDWVHLKSTAPKTRTAFTRFIDENEVITCPVAHAEGRFSTVIQGLLDKLIKNKQIIFRYSDARGNTIREFPINPNGSLWNIAAISNPEGNVMLLMPHFERSEESQTFFTSMKSYIENGSKTWEKAKKLVFPVPHDFHNLPQKKYFGDPQSFQMLVDLIITDNEAETFQFAVKRLGLNNVKLRRQTHFEIAYQKIRSRAGLEKFARKIIQSGLLLNTNKETASVMLPKKNLKYLNQEQKLEQAGEIRNSNEISILVRDKQNFAGMAKTQTFKKRLKMDKIAAVKKGILWHIEIDSKSEAAKEKILKKLIKLHLFANPHSQEILLW